MRGTASDGSFFSDWEIVSKMPSKAELSHPSAVMSLHRDVQQSSYTWTDDLPVCHLSGVGVSTNQLYREDGQRREEHEFEDRCFHFKIESGTCLYGLFDGHDGNRASDFASQRMPAELLLGQLTNRTSDGEIRDALEQAFVAVEKGFFQSIDHLLAQRTNLQLELPEGLNDYQTCQQFPEIIDNLRALHTEISGGSTAVVALIQNEKLYVANVGDSRALLVCENHQGGITVQQLSIDHDIRNEDERLRLKSLGLDVEKIMQGSKLGNQDNTRCLGNFMVKGGYKDFDILSSAKGEPVIAEPYICGGIQIDTSCRFLLLMSDGLYRSLGEATGTSQANEDISQMVLEQFSLQSTLMGVAQAVVDRVVRIHHDKYMHQPSAYQKRDDISLLVRNFGQPFAHLPSHPYFSLLSTTDSSVPTISTTSTTESRVLTNPTDHSAILVDDEGYIDPYVDFSDFYKALQQANTPNAYFSNNDL